MLRESLVNIDVDFCWGLVMSKIKSFFGAIFRMLLVIVIVGGLFVLVSWFLSTRVSETYSSPLTPVQIAKAERRTIESSIELSGYIEAEAMIPVVPFVNGTISSYNIKEGDFVKKGDILCQIDKAPYELQVAQARAASIVYDATYDRIATLVEAGAATKQQLDEIKAQKDAGSAQLELAKLQLSYTDVAAPVSGTVIAAPSAVGDIGNTASPVAIIADLNNLIVNISIPEKYYSLINEGKDELKVSVIKPSSGISDEVVADTEIISISPYVDPISKSFTMCVKIKDNISSFVPGMYIKSKIVYSRDDVYALSLSARNVDGSAYFIDYSNGETRAKFIDASNVLCDNNYFEIDSEYKDFDFIVRGQNSVLSGQLVQIVEGF